MRKLLSLFLILIAAVTLFAQENPLWMRYTSISPDGMTILFCYKGDLWSVPSTGGKAVPLTLTESYEYAPVWSHDGKTIAFASDRNGNFDVFVMAANGGEAKRLTFHSAREIPSNFTANNKDVIFSAYRQDLSAQAQFPVSMMGELYTVPVA
ncbi:MAG: peptidase S41, partial [Bacteroidota bacterium]